MSAKQIKKMSVATVFGKIKVAELLTQGADGKLVSKGEVKLFRVFGRVVGVKGGISTYGEWEALVGQFRAITNEGEILDSGTLFLPDIALTAVKVALSGNASADFAIDLFVEYNEASEQKYTYTFRHVMPPSNDDPLTMMMTKIEALLLPAPETKQETKPEEKKPTRK